MALIWVSRRSIRVWDFCSIKDGLHKRHDVRRANVQRIDLGLLTGDPETKIKPWLSKVHERLIRALAEAGVEIYFINPENEADYIRDAGDSDAKVRGIVVERFRFYVADFRRLGVPLDRIIINTSWGLEEMMEIWPGAVFELHGCNSDVRLAEYLARWPARTLFPNGDGPDPYAQGHAGDKPTAREPSVAQAATMRPMIKWGYAYFYRSIEAGAPDIRRAWFGLLKPLMGR